MKAILVLMLVFSSNLFANTVRETLSEYQNECKTTEVTVEEIVKNSHIKGHIKGLPTDAYSKFKMVFYVKTNRWYVHPYTYSEGQEEGYSYSNIKEDGSFWVRTVRRDVPSSQLAAVLVPKDYRIVSQRWFLKPLFGIFGGILKNSCNYTLVQGNGDFLH